MISKLMHVVATLLMAFSITACFSQQKQCDNPSLHIPPQSRPPIHSFVELHGNLLSMEVLTGSGVVIASNHKGSYLLTADHVCRFMEGKELPYDFPPDITAQDIQPLLSLQVETLQGELYKGEVVKRDKASDLCMLLLPGVSLPSVLIADKGPILADRYYTLSSPSGMGGDGRVLRYEGFHAGAVTHQQEDYTMYTIFGAPGSSGGGIFNEDHHLVGIISKASIDGTGIILSPTYKDLRKFITEVFCPGTSTICRSSTH